MHVQICAYERMWRCFLKHDSKLVKEKNTLLSVKIEGEKQYHMHPNRTAGCFNLNQFQPSLLKTEVNHVGTNSYWEDNKECQ